MTRKICSIRLTPELRNWCASYAEEYNFSSFGDIIEQLCYLARYGHPDATSQGKILEFLQAALSGELQDHHPSASADAGYITPEVRTKFFEYMNSNAEIYANLYNNGLYNELKRTPERDIINGFYEDYDYYLMRTEYNLLMDAWLKDTKTKETMRNILIRKMLEK